MLIFFGSAKLYEDSKTLVQQLKQNKNGEDIFTQKNLDLVTHFLKEREGVSAAERQQLRVVEFPPNYQWLNCEPISMEKHLKGKIVLMDFWTYCCIHCLHVLPDLEYLQQKFNEEPSMVFLGCHSAKFLNERNSSKVRDAILKYEIKHPVVSDDRMILWKSYERRSWPS